MEQKMLRSTQRQLRGLADGIGGAGDEQAAVLMAQAGASLIANCARMSGAVLGGMGEDSFDDLMDAVVMLMRRTEEMMNHPRCAALAQQAQQLVQLRQAGDAAAAAGRSARQEVERLRTEVAAMEEDNRALDAEVHTLMNNSAKLAEESDRINQFFYDGMKRLEQMTRQKEELDRRWGELEPDLRHRAQEILDQERALERLNADQQEFGPERQAQLRAEIDALEQQTQGSRRAVEGLNESLGRLRESVGQLKDQRSLLEGEALEAVHDVLSRMDATSDARLTELEDVRRTVDTLDERLSACRGLREDYASWLEANGATMDELARILGENDPLHGALRETLDPAQTARLRQLRITAQESLREMDALLSPCIRLMSSSRRAVLGKVAQGPGRREAAHE